MMIGERVEKLLSNKYFPAFTVAFLLVLPNLIWILLDKGLWRGDPCGYALNAVSLYQNLITDLRAWRGFMFNGYKGPLIFWMGQFLVPLGNFIGSINFALLSIPFIASFVSLVLLFKSFELMFKNKTIAVCGALMVAASPLFNGLANGFWIEPLQVAIISWFIYSLLKAKTWNFYFALAQLVVVISLAMLAKVSTPLYIVGPCIAFWFIVFKNKPSFIWNKKSVVALVVAFLFFIPTLVFYAHNFRFIFAFAHFAGTSVLFEMPASRFDFWVQFISNGIFYEHTYYLSIVIVALGFWRSIQQKTTASYSLVFIVAVAQIVIFFIAWMKGNNADSRYFLPALPYFALLVCWGLYSINNKLINALVLLVFVFQFFELAAFNYGFISFTPSYGMIRPIQKEQDQDTKITRLLVPLAVRDSAIIFDLNPQLGVAEFQYEFAKTNLNANWQHSSIDISDFFNYDHQQIDTTKINVDTVWQNVLNTKPDYYITWKSRLDPTKAEEEIRRIDKYNAITVRQRWAIAVKLKNCARYKTISFKAYPELLVYKRCDLP